MQRKTVLAIFALSAMASTVMAGPVLPALITGQPLQYTKDGEINGCGLRFFAVTEASLPTERVRMIDASVNVFDPGVAMVKGGMKTTTMETILAQNLDPEARTIVAINRIWLRPIGGQITKLAKGATEIRPSNDGALIYAADLSGALAVINAVLDKKQLQMGVGDIGQDTEIILTGVAKLDEGDRQQFADCFSTWSKRLLKKK